MSDSLAITLLVLAGEIGLLAFCYHRSRKPIDPLHPRLVPYNIVMIFLVVAIFATVAHIVSLVTGQQLMPRRRRGLR